MVLIPELSVPEREKSITVCPGHVHDVKISGHAYIGFSEAAGQTPGAGSPNRLLALHSVNYRSDKGGFDAPRVRRENHQVSDAGIVPPYRVPSCVDEFSRSTVVVSIFYSHHDILPVFFGIPAAFPIVCVDDPYIRK